MLGLCSLRRGHADAGHAVQFNCSGDVRVQGRLRAILLGPGRELLLGLRSGHLRCCRADDMPGLRGRYVLVCRRQRKRGRNLGMHAVRTGNLLVDERGLVFALPRRLVLHHKREWQRRRLRVECVRWRMCRRLVLTLGRLCTSPELYRLWRTDVPALHSGHVLGAVRRELLIVPARYLC